MPEQDLAGVATPTTPAQAAQVEQQAPPVQTQQAPVPSGGGKSVDELAKEVEEASRIAHEAQERMDRMAHERELERAYYSNLTAGKPQQQEPDLPTISDDEFLANPGKALTKIIDSRFEREKAERERREASQYIDTARRSHETGWSAAVKSNPGLFRGIETSVRSEILANVRDSFQAGRPVDVDILENPKYYEAAAVAMRIMNGEDVQKYYAPHQTQPMAPVHTETPSAGNPPQAGMTLSPEQEELIARAGIKREQFIESLGKVRAAQAERSK